MRLNFGVRLLITTGTIEPTMRMTDYLAISEAARAAQHLSQQYSAITEASRLMSGVRMDEMLWASSAARQVSEYMKQHQTIVGEATAALRPLLSMSEQLTRAMRPHMVSEGLLSQAQRVAEDASRFTSLHLRHLQQLNIESLRVAWLDPTKRLQLGPITGFVTAGGLLADAPELSEGLATVLAREFDTALAEGGAEDAPEVVIATAEAVSRSYPAWNSAVATQIIVAILLAWITQVTNAIQAKEVQLLLAKIVESVENIELRLDESSLYRTTRRTLIRGQPTVDVEVQSTLGANIDLHAHGQRGSWLLVSYWDPDVQVVRLGWVYKRNLLKCPCD